MIPAWRGSRSSRSTCCEVRSDDGYSSSPRAHACAPGAGAAPTTILHGIDLVVPHGQFLALTGASGSGKSTLLYLLGCLDRQTAGEIWLDGVEVSALDDDDRAAFRNERLGFVFQFHFLLPEFSVLENVTIPMLRRGVPRDDAEERAYETLGLLGSRSCGSGSRDSSRADSNSASRLRAQSPTIPRSSSPTSRPETSTRRTASWCSTSSRASQGRRIGRS